MRGSETSLDWDQAEFFFPPVPSYESAVREYWLSFPREVLRSIRDFPGDYAFHLAQWCAAGGQRLLSRLPLLGFMGALRSRQEIQRLTCLSDSKLVTRLGLECESVEAALDVVRRVPAEVVTPQMVAGLRSILAPTMLTRERLDGLRREERVNLGVLRLVSMREFYRVVEPWLLSKVALCRAEDRVARTAVKIEHALKLAEVVGRPGRVSFGSFEEIDEFLIWMGKVLGTMHPGKGPRFAKPPVPGVHSRAMEISPIEAGGALRVEGQMMNNCAAQMMEDVLGGQSYFYRMLRPERVTVKLSRMPGGYWGVEDIRSVSNGMPERATVSLVAYWVSVQQDGVGCDEVLPAALLEHAGGRYRELACAV